VHIVSRHFYALAVYNPSAGKKKKFLWSFARPYAQRATKEITAQVVRTRFPIIYTSLYARRVVTDIDTGLSIAYRPPWNCITAAVPGKIRRSVTVRRLRYADAYKEIMASSKIRNGCGPLKKGKRAAIMGVWHGLLYERAWPCKSAGFRLNRTRYSWWSITLNIHGGIERTIIVTSFVCETLEDFLVTW